MIRQFPAALKLYDRVLDITPNDSDVMVAKASIYQAQGNLQEAARFVSEINWQTPSENAFSIKINELQLERNYGEAIRLLQARQAQFHFANDFEKSFDQVSLAFLQCLAGDTAGARAIAEQARDILEQLDRDEPDNDLIATTISQAYAVMRQNDSALKAAERAVMLLPRTKDAVSGPRFEENLALVQMMCEENSCAISTLGQLLQTPYAARPAPITPALLRLDPIWDPLRSDPDFQKLCEE